MCSVGHSVAHHLEIFQAGCGCGRGILSSVLRVMGMPIHGMYFNFLSKTSKYYMCAALTQLKLYSRAWFDKHPKVILELNRLCQEILRDLAQCGPRFPVPIAMGKLGAWHTVAGGIAFEQIEMQIQSTINSHAQTTLPTLVSRFLNTVHHRRATKGLENRERRED